MNQPDKEVRRLPEGKLFLLDENDLRRVIIENTPQLRQQIETMTNILREMDQIERKKLGLDSPRGAIWLHQNKDKKLHTDPDLIGHGQVAGTPYQVAAWIGEKNNLKIGLIARTRHDDRRFSTTP